MAQGTPDGAKSSNVDPVLTSALADMAQDGFNAAEPFSDQPQDAPLSPVASIPGDGGTSGTPATSATPAAPATAVAETAPATPAATPAPGTATPDATAATSPDADPLAGAEPFTYTVDGQAKTMEGVYRFPNEGMMVPEALVPKFQLMASRSESLEKANRDLYQRVQETDRLTEWKVQGQDGTEQTLTGRAAIEAERVLMGRLVASVKTLSEPFQGSPLQYITTDADGNVVWNRQAFEHLATRSELAEMAAERAVRQQFETRFQAAQHAAQQAPPVDVAAAAPVIVDTIAQQAQATTLTAADKQFLVGMLPRFVRATTAEDIRLNPALATEAQVVDSSFVELVQRQAALRTESTKQQQATEAAATFNAGQQRGRVAPKAATPAPAPAAPAAAPTKQGRAEVWEGVLANAMTELST